MNNLAEYEALIAGLKLATELEVGIIDIFGDSQLVAKQISGEFKAHNENMAKYLSITQELLKKISSWKISNVDRAENQWADSLAKLSSSNSQINLDPIYVDILTSPTIDAPSVNHIQNDPDWRKPFLEYILENKLPMEKSEARSIMFKARNYCIIGSVLYRRALTEPLLRCLGPKEADQAILEVYTGICGEHLGGKNLALKIIRQGLYWPTLRKDCEDFIQKCQACQCHGKNDTSKRDGGNPIPPRIWRRGCFASRSQFDLAEGRSIRPTLNLQGIYFYNDLLEETREQSRLRIIVQ
ncbi:uncharacterized protein LOC141718723 [Apium graveolens]|uniref:uncharacterized protein LOC141718723 n=1 Tax=Apium graveolens TaxID=4045 RepID=UPI003D7A1947